jgi:N-acyl amino acid synthase of PEP-CTERM/exosortase system
MTENRGSSLNGFSAARIASGDPAIGLIERLRFQVYCLECHFLEAADYPDHRETDGHDPYAIHFAAFDGGGDPIATMRLVLDSALGFPLERHAPMLSPRFRDLPRSTTAEVSRLIVARSYRRRAHDGLYGADVGGPTPGEPTARPRVRKRSDYPLILFTLFRAMYEESLRLGLTCWLAAMEPALERLLRRFGLVFTPIGPPMDYFGEVVPYMAFIEDLEAIVAAQRPDVLRFFRSRAER